MKFESPRLIGVRRFAMGVGQAGVGSFPDGEGVVFIVLVENEWDVKMNNNNKKKHFFEGYRRKNRSFSLWNKMIFHLTPHSHSASCLVWEYIAGFKKFISGRNIS